MCHFVSAGHNSSTLAQGDSSAGLTNPKLMNKP